MAKHQFSTILELANNYRDKLHGNCYPIDIHFRIGSEWGPKFGKRFKKPPLTSANFWMSVALLLTYDIIHECGPDCHEFFELFTNDYRDNSDNFDMAAWEQIRCKILGNPERIDINRIPRGRIRYCELVEEPPKKPYKAKVEIALVSESNDLAAGETTMPTIIKEFHSIIPHSEHAAYYPHGACWSPKGFWKDKPGIHNRFRLKLGDSPDMI
jgi:hypothetical protein